MLLLPDGRGLEQMEVVPGSGSHEMEDFMQPVAHLADELRSEDPMARVEAMRRLSTIALALGQERTRNELVPFLENSLDDDDEVLLAMADEMGGFVQYVGGPEYAYLLLKTLEGLAGADETVVRDAAIDSMGKVLIHLKPEELAEHILPMIKRMAAAEWFPKKSSAAHLIGLVASRIPGDTEHSDLRRIMTSLSNDDTAIVRKAVLNNLGRLVRATHNQDVLMEEIHPLLAKLASDSQDAVRLLSVGPLAAFGEMVRESLEASQTLFEPIFQSLATDRSWRIRFMLAKHFAQLAVVLPKGSTTHPVKAFAALLKDAEPEVRTEAATELVHVAKVTPPEDVRAYLVPCLPMIVTDPSAHVKAALALSLNDLSPIVGPNTTVEFILPLIIKLLSDESSDVRLNIVSNFEKTVQVIGIDLLYDVLLPAIARLSQDGQWRVRETIISLIPALARLLGHHRYDEKLAELGLGWLDDPVSCVRSAAGKCHAHLIKAFGTQWALDSGLIDKLLQLATHENYLRRQVCLGLAADLLTQVSVDYVTIGFLMPVVEGLRSDPVPNVRITLTKVIQSVTPILLAERPDILRDTCLPALQQLSIDPDQDVQFFSQQALNLIPAL